MIIAKTFKNVSLKPANKINDFFVTNRKWSRQEISFPSIHTLHIYTFSLGKTLFVY
jgi:hypothetical protein